MAEPLSTSTAAGVALLKMFGIPVGAGALAAAMGFLFLWPATQKEAFARFASSIVCSSVFGPVLVSTVRLWWPSLFDSAKETAVLYGQDPFTGLIFVASPFLVMAGLPAWWVFGALFRWFYRHRDQDIAELASDAAKAVRDVRGSL